jgi:hypothetical protein
MRGKLLSEVIKKYVGTWATVIYRPVSNFYKYEGTIQPENITGWLDLKAHEPKQEGNCISTGNHSFNKRNIAKIITHDGKEWK